MTQTLSGPYETAVRLVQAGISVIPIGRVKQPACSWKPFQTRLPTLSELASWYSEPERHGIGIVCGAVSGNLEVIDFDIRNLDSLRELVQRFLDNVAASCGDFPLQALAMVQTPGPGIQLYYRCKSPIGGNQKLARRPGEFDPETGTSRGSQYFIETRGEGGYVLSVGSPGHCHPTGGTYRHISGPAIHELQPVITNVQRDILLCEARSLGIQEQPEARKEAVSVLQAPEGSAGADFNQRASWPDILTPFGFEHVGRSGDVDQWRRPGTANPVSATTGYGDSDLFYAFSPNCGYGIEADRGYSKFAIYTHLNHGGDFTSAAKALGEQGYGTRPEMPQIDISAVLNPVEHGKIEVIKPIPIKELVKQFPSLSEPIFEGFLRRGETCNLIAPTKAGKSWLSYGMALSVATGKPWLNHFQCKRGRVLMIDNELHPQTIAFRIPTVAKALGLSEASYDGRLDHVPLRGRIQGLDQISRSIIAPLEHGEYDVIFLDAWYRAIPSGKGENDNAAMAEAFNLVDRLAHQTGAAWVLVHHSSKGDQSDKRVTDVGSGAGSQSRAADTHMIFREHQQENCVTLEAAVRSFPPLKPVTMRWDFPLWLVVDHSLDPSALKVPKTRQDRQQESRDAQGCTEVLKALESGPQTKKNLRQMTGMGNERLDRICSILLRQNLIREESVGRMNYICKIRQDCPPD